MPSSESTARLQEAGFDIDSASEELETALATLSDSEVGVLVKVKHLLEEASPEVEAHEDSSGGWLW